MNTKIKIAMLGAGTASCVAMATMIYKHKSKELTSSKYWHIRFEIDITCIHDPDIAIFPVGESISPIVHEVIRVATGYSYYNDVHEFDETARWGTKNFWNKAGEDFSIIYKDPGIHANAAKLAPGLMKRFNNLDYFREIHDTVKEIVQDKNKVSIVGSKNIYRDFDYVFDCRGFPDETSLHDGSYSFPGFKSINAVLLYQDFKNYGEEFTSAYVHENGWMFGVPLEHRKAFGYTYNSEITSEEDAINNFLENLNYYVGLKDVAVDKIKKVKWSQFYKNTIIDGRVITIGNKLYFFDPQMGVPLHFVYSKVSDFLDIVNRAPKFDLSFIQTKFNALYKKHMGELQDVLPINYAGKTKINSPFWNLKQKEAYDFLQNSESFYKWYKNTKMGKPPELLGVPGFNIELLTQYIDGYKIDLDNMFKERWLAEQVVLETEAML